MVLRSKILTLIVTLAPWVIIFFPNACEVKAVWPIAVVAALFGVFNFYHSVPAYSNELSFYQKSGNLSQDSGIRVTYKGPGEMNGYIRLFLYYPMIFAASSAFVMVFVLKLSCLLWR